jgi:hypothetical protein
MVRFPRVGTVCDDYSDEKVAMEVTALTLIHNRTTIPVPRVQAWGPGVGSSCQQPTWSRSVYHNGLH